MILKVARKVIYGACWQQTSLIFLSLFFFFFLKKTQTNKKKPIITIIVHLFLSTLNCLALTALHVQLTLSNQLAKPCAKHCIMRD